MYEWVGPSDGPPAIPQPWQVMTAALISGGLEGSSRVAGQFVGTAEQLA